MKTLKLHFAKAAVASIDGSEGNTITLLDALNGQMGQVMDIDIILNVENLQRPAIPFIDASKINTQTTSPQQPQLKSVTNGHPPASQKVVRLRSNTKVSKMFDLLTKKSRNKPVGITRSELAKEMGQIENGATAYLYNYPKKWGCTIGSEVRTDNNRYYWLEIPEGIRFEVI